MANNYKRDDNKPPVLDAVFIPYRRSILAIARMKADMAVKHKLQGAVNPFLEWAQLPEAQKRLGNAGGRHILDPWSLNTADALPGTKGHLHMVHGIVGMLMALELYLKAQEEEGADVPDFSDSPEQMAERARVELALQGEHQAEPLHHPAGADWREKPAQCLHECPHVRGTPLECARDKGHTGDHRSAHGLTWANLLGTCKDCGHPMAEHDCGFCYAPGCSCPVLKAPPAPGGCVNGNHHALNPYTGKCARCEAPMERVGG